MSNKVQRASSLLLSSSNLSRRQLLITGAGTAAGLAAGLLGPAAAFAAFSEGADYTRVTPAQPTEHPGKIEVTEFFGYWCPHCNEFDPILSDWVKKQRPDVAMRYVPIAFYDQQVPLQRLYYTLKALGQDEALRSKVFYAIHSAKIPLDTGEEQAAWAASNGIDKKKFLDLYNSFSIQADARRASTTATAYDVSSIPTLAVNGKYTVLGSERALATVDFLVDQERKGGK
jgi:thiol:disulfide interchange protein DsbA